MGVVRECCYSSSTSIRPRHRDFTTVGWRWLYLITKTFFLVISPTLLFILQLLSVSPHSSMGFASASYVKNSDLGFHNQRRTIQICTLPFSCLCRYLRVSQAYYGWWYPAFSSLHFHLCPFLFLVLPPTPRLVHLRLSFLSFCCVSSVFCHIEYDRHAAMFFISVVSRTCLGHLFLLGNMRKQNDSLHSCCCPSCAARTSTSHRNTITYV